MMYWRRRAIVEHIRRSLRHNSVGRLQEYVLNDEQIIDYFSAESRCTMVFKLLVLPVAVELLIRVYPTNLSSHALLFGHIIQNLPLAKLWRHNKFHE